MAADVTRREDLDAAVAAAIETWGRLDVAFANAGISSGDTSETVASVADGVFEKVIAVNLQGVGTTIRAALPAVLDAQGHILITSSTYAYVNGMVNAPYAATRPRWSRSAAPCVSRCVATGATAGVLYPGGCRHPSPMSPSARTRSRQPWSIGLFRHRCAARSPRSGRTRRRRRDREPTREDPDPATVDTRLRACAASSTRSPTRCSAPIAHSSTWSARSRVDTSR